MTFPEVLEKHGCGEARLREIFTAPRTSESPEDAQLDMDPTAAINEQTDRKPTDSQIRTRWENKIRGRILEGINSNLRSARPNQAVDLAWDTPTIQRHTIPLLMWAQGKISIETCYNTLCGATSQTQADKFFQKKTVHGREVLSLKVSRISDITIDLMRSYVTRRHAAMDALWSNLWPLMRYEPRGVDDVATLRGDVLTQRVDIISDAYNYRHFLSQCRRQMLLYGFSVAFPKSKWDVKTGLRFKPTNTGEPTDETESYVVREGVDLVNPHPSRIFYDTSAPLANINTDTGPSYLGYWDVVRWETLRGRDSPYFNLNQIFTTSGWLGLANQYGDFLGYYFDPCVLKWPDVTGPDPTLWNDRQVNVGRYAATARDLGILRTHYFERINPKYEHIGNYDADVWAHVTVAADCTIIGIELLPSMPGAYGAVNWNDGRLANQSMGMALLAYQDQASNIVSSTLMQLRTSLIQLWLLDKDSLEPEILKEFQSNAADADWWVDRKLLIYSATKLRDLGIQDPGQAFKVVQAQVSDAFDAGLKQLTQLLNLADRLLILSPNELGQPNPREVSAREVTDISTSVQSMYSFINQGPREQIAAVKELVYESLICCGTQNFRVPVERRYTKKVIEDAGLALPSTVRAPEGNEDFLPVKTPVLGNLRQLVYDYYFDSRDGAERVVNTQGATVVLQLLQSLLQVPQLAQIFGVKNIAEMANTVIRMSGAPTNFQFEFPVGNSQELGDQEPEIKQTLAALTEQVGKIAQFLSQQAPRPAPPQASPNGSGVRPMLAEPAQAAA